MLQRIGRVPDASARVRLIEACAKPWRYRNKMTFTFSPQNMEPSPAGVRLSLLQCCPDPWGYLQESCMRQDLQDLHESCQPACKAPIQNTREHPHVLRELLSKLHELLDYFESLPYQRHLSKASGTLLCPLGLWACCRYPLLPGDCL